ncbi:MAG: septum site-determining protein MinD [Pseudomonadota bacterium]
MSKIIVVTSAKPGVGKTTTSAAFAAGIALRGYKTVVVDFDVGLQNLGLVMGCDQHIDNDFVNVINGKASLKQALIKDKRLDNLYILPASQTSDKNALSLERVAKVLEALKKHFKYIICDSPPGIKHGTIMAMYFADEALIITNQDIASVRDSDQIIGTLSTETNRAMLNLSPVEKYSLLTRYVDKPVDSGKMLDAKDVKEILAIPMLGIIPESHAVSNASENCVPIVFDKKSNAGLAYIKAIARFMEEESSKSDSNL